MNMHRQGQAITRLYGGWPEHGTKLRSDGSDKPAHLQTFTSALSPLVRR